MVKALLSKPCLRHNDQRLVVGILMLYIVLSAHPRLLRWPAYHLQLPRLD